MEAKRALVFDTTRRKHVDMLFLQEMHSHEHTEHDWDKEWEGHVVLSHNSIASRGEGPLFSRSFTPTSLEMEHVDRER